MRFSTFQSGFLYSDVPRKKLLFLTWDMELDKTNPMMNPSPFMHPFHGVK